MLSGYTGEAGKKMQGRAVASSGFGQQLLRAGKIGCPALGNGYLPFYNREVHRPPGLLESSAQQLAGKIMSRKELGGWSVVSKSWAKPVGLAKDDRRVKSMKVASE